MPKKNGIRFVPGRGNSQPEVAYLYLPDHPDPEDVKLMAGIVKETIDLRELIPGLTGPSVYLDIGEGKMLLGIEIIAG